MFRKKITLLIFAAILAMTAISGSFIVSSQINQKRADVTSSSGLKQKPDNLRARPNTAAQQDQDNRNIPQDIPDEVIYRQVFKHIEELNKKADEGERKNRKDGKKFRNLYKQMARLDERQARILDKIAKDTNSETKKLDDRAKQIIESIRSRTPDHRIEQGQKPPLPPQELFDLSKRRKDLTIKAINDLRANFGEAEFVRFSQFVNERVKTGIRKKGNRTANPKGGILR